MHFSHTVIIPAHREDHACRSSVCLPVNCDSAAVSVHRVSQKRPNPGSSALVHDDDVEVPWLGILILGHVKRSNSHGSRVSSCQS